MNNVDHNRQIENKKTSFMRQLMGGVCTVGINVLLALNINDEIFDAISQVDRTNALLDVFVSTSYLYCILKKLYSEKCVLL